MNFKGWKKLYSQDKNNYFRINEPEKVIKALQSVATNDKFKHVKYFVVDTINNLMVSEEMRRCKEKGYDKWMDLAQEIWQLVELPGKLRDDLVVILLFHTQTEHLGTPMFQYKEFLTGWGGNYGTDCHTTWLLMPYLASINNLAQAIVKNADKTMKITYTLTEVEENS